MVRMMAMMITAMPFIKIRRFDPLSSELRSQSRKTRHHHENSLGPRHHHGIGNVDTMAAEGQPSHQININTHLIYTLLYLVMSNTSRSICPRVQISKQ